MALLQRVRILPNERLDLPDFRRIEDFVCADLKAIHKNVTASENFVFSGFIATGTGTAVLTVPVANSSLIVGLDDAAIFVGAPTLAALTTDDLSPSTTNYVELFLSQDTGGADSRAFWDPTANSNQGAEFSQIVDTFSYLKVNFRISTSNFSGASDAIKICEVDVNGSGIITQIRDARDLYFRLGRGSDPAHSFPWASRTEPPSTQFTGADKDIKNQKQANDAMQDSLREIKGTTYWFEPAPVNLQGSFRNVGLSELVQATAGARFSWDGAEVSITDTNPSPTDSDIVAHLRMFDTTANLDLTRQAGANAIPLADGEVLWIELPNPIADEVYDGVGLTSSNYRVSARGSVPLDSDTYWIAYREGVKLYVRGLGEMDPGEDIEIEDQLPEALKLFLGFDPETATSVPYTVFPNGALLPATFTTADSLVTAIDAETENINFLADVLAKNPYEERMDVVSGVPVNDNEIQGPVAANTIITLPFDSRDSDSIEYYVVGKGQLQVYLNGIYLDNAIDWEEVGVIGNQSTQIRILIDLSIGDKIMFRNAQAGGLVFSGAPVPVSLQDAYNNGNTITTTIGQPFTVGGAASKVAQFNGDIGVTGVIDPLGITFIPTPTNPLQPTDNGLWVNMAEELVHSRPSMPDINVTQMIEAAGEGAQVDLENQSGSTLTKLTPVCIDVAGYIDVIDPSSEDDAFATVGVVAADILNTEVGKVATGGKLTNITTSASFRDVLFVSKTGGVTNVKPTIGVDGFVAGDWVIQLGVVSRNVDNPLQKDLIVNVKLVVQL